MPTEIIVEFPSPLTDKEKKMIYGYKGEVVRCKDCKHWDNHDSGERCLNKIAYLSWAKPNSFCSYAERKGEVEDETD